MKTDRTTKILLGIIAICLLYFVGKDIVTPANASKAITDVNIAQVDGRDVGPFGIPLPVEIAKD